MQNTSLTDFCRAEKLVQHLNGAAVVRWSILPSGKPDNSDVRLSTPGNFARVEVSIWNLTDNVVDVRPDTFRLAVNGLVLSPDVGATCRDPLPSAGLMPGHSVEGSLIYRVEPDSDWETLQMVTSERGFFPMVRQWPGKERITKADLKICSSNRQKVLLYLIAAASNEAKGKDDAGLLMDRYSRASALIWERFIRETRRNDLTTYLVDSCTVRNNRAYLKLSAVNSPERPDSTVMAICALDESSVRIEAFKVGADVTDFASENKRIFPDLLKHVQADESLN